MVKNKRAVSRRRYHSVLRDALRSYCDRLCTATLKYERAAFLITCRGLRGLDTIFFTNSQFIESNHNL